VARLRVGRGSCRDAAGVGGIHPGVVENSSSPLSKPTKGIADVEHIDGRKAAVRAIATDEASAALLAQETPDGCPKLRPGSAPSR